MTKEEIKRKITELKNDTEILEFVKSRIMELTRGESNETVGFKYKNIHTDFISKNTRYIVGQSPFGSDYPSLVFDDIKPYFDMIKELSISKEYSNELYLFTPLTLEIFKYLSSNDSKANADTTAERRDKMYLNALRNNEKQISIKEFHKDKIGLCGENAGLAHNIFKILGIDSELVMGIRNDELHAYNIVFPRGYENGPAVLFDPSYFIHFTNEKNEGYSLAYFKVLTLEEYTKMLSGQSVIINLEGTINNLLRYYSALAGLNASYENANYSIGFEEPLEQKRGK